jgi:hypothetical protein
MGGVQIGAATSQGNGGYAFASLPSGAYELRQVQPEWLPFSSTADVVPIVVHAGEVVTVDFGDWNGLPSYLPVLVR